MRRRRRAVRPEEVRPRLWAAVQPATIWGDADKILAPRSGDTSHAREPWRQASLLARLARIRCLLRRLLRLNIRLVIV